MIIPALAFRALPAAAALAGSVARVQAPTSAPDLGPILLFGLPRSGTSWLGKILDSHPATLYRHEPERVLEDFGLPWICPPDQAALLAPAARAYLGRMIGTATVTTIGPAPHFSKSFRDPPRAALHAGLAHGFRALARFDPRRGGLHNLRLPDLTRGAQPRMVVKSVSGHGRAGLLADCAPSARVVLLLRDLGGQVESVLRGSTGGKFVEKVDLDWIPATAPARRHALTAAGLARMDRLEQLAWQWVIGNEMLLDDLRTRPNAMVIRYDDLCADPLAAARRIFDFVGLSWSARTEAFIAASTSGQGPAGYYTVFRDPAAARDRWRTRMAPEARRRIAAILRQSPLADWWPDFHLAAAGADFAP